MPTSRSTRSLKGYKSYKLVPINRTVLYARSGIVHATRQSRHWAMSDGEARTDQVAPSQWAESGRLVPLHHPQTTRPTHRSQR